VCSFACRSAEFFTSIEKICNHVEEVVQKYDGKYGLVAWYAGNHELHVAVTANLGTGDLYMKDLMDMVLTTIDRIESARHLLVYPKTVKTFWGHGHSKSGTKDSQGFWNKKSSISRILSKLDKAGNMNPVVVLLASRSQSSSFTLPLGDGWLSNQAKNLLERLDQAGVKDNMRLMGQIFGELMAHDTAENREVKKRRTFRASLVRREDGGYVGIDVSHKTGTVQWYTNQLGSSKSPGVHALYKTNILYKWAMVDARISGEKMSVQHNMFAEVTLQHDGEEWDVHCTCDVFNSWNDATCVHKEYVNANCDRLMAMQFAESDEVVALNNRAGQNFGYYYAGAFVRKQGSKGYRCDKDMSYRCRHVVKAYEAFDLCVGSQILFGEYDQPEEENEEPYDDIEEVRMDFGYGDISFAYPFTEEMRRTMVKLAQYGFGPDPSKPMLWFGEALRPDLPTTPCKCGQMYNTSGYSRVNTCKVYLGTPHCGREMHLYHLQCPRMSMGCVVPYNGLEHGLVRISMSQVVELDLLVDSFLDVVRFGGVSLTAQCEKMRSRYAHFREGGTGQRHVQFLEANLFRRAVYTVAKNIKLQPPVPEAPPEEEDVAESSCGPNPLLCPICKDQPRCIIMDGTSLTMRSKAFKSASMTAPTCKDVKKRPHTRNMRAFLNVSPLMDRGAAARTELAKLLKEFCAWMTDVLSLSRRSTPRFKELERLLRLADKWDIGRFISWAHKEARGMTIEQVRAVCLLLQSIASTSSVTQYFSYDVAMKIEAFASREWRDVPWTECAHLGPVVGRLLDAFRPEGCRTVAMHADWVPLIDEMIERVYVVHSRAYDGSEYGLGPSIPVPSQPTAVDGRHIVTGVCSGLPKIRERPIYEIDGDFHESKEFESDKAGCRHSFVKPGDRTGGVFSCVCEHGVCYAIFVIKNAEGRNEPFTWMTTHLRKAPKYVVYDFACSLMEYCLNRAPNFFRHTLFLVDVFHWVNHTACCPTFSIRQHHGMADRIRNSQACEQLNAAMKRLKFVISKMNQEPFMVFLRLFAYEWNLKKIQKCLRLRECQPQAPNALAGMQPESCMGDQRCSQAHD
jgi:hypothetical protein